MTPGSTSTSIVRTDGRKPTPALRLIIVAAFALPLAACAGGNGGGEQATLEGYLAQVEAILQESDRRFEQLEAQGLTGQDILSPQEAVPLQEQARDIISEALTDLRGLKPPEEAKREHEELVVAANNYVHELDAIIGQLRNAQTEEDVRALFEEIPGSPLDESANRLDSACLQLQDVAVARGIDADLGCTE